MALPEALWIEKQESGSSGTSDLPNHTRKGMNCMCACDIAHACGSSGMITHMLSGMRILVASPLGHVVASPLETGFQNVTVAVATDSNEFVRSIAGRVRFDVVVADLIWNRPEMEWSFDGLDVVDALVTSDRLAPVLLATQGHSMERDHIDEARLRTDVRGIIAKAAGFNPLINAIRSVALGQRLPMMPVHGNSPPLYELFTGQRGRTAARLAGTIASGNASDNASLARVAKVSLNTANKVTSHYLGPLIEARGEHDDQLPMTQAAVYRWCGLHARYIVSWCRRNGEVDVLSPSAGQTSQTVIRPHLPD